MSNKREHGEKLRRETHAPRSFVHEGLCGGKLRVEVSTTELQNGGFGLGLQIIQITQFRESLSSGLGRTGLRRVF